jgi:site-specific recombinase XerC
MKKQLPNLLGAIVRDYFTDHLPRVRGTSPHTIHGYRDSLVLLLRFLSARHKRPIAELDLKDLEPVRILAFLSHLEKERKNGVATETSGSPLFMPCFVSWLRGIPNIWAWPSRFSASHSSAPQNRLSTT